MPGPPRSGPRNNRHNKGTDKAKNAHILHAGGAMKTAANRMESWQNCVDPPMTKLVKTLPRLKNVFGGTRTHAPEETGALIQRLRPLGHEDL